MEFVYALDNPCFRSTPSKDMSINFVPIKIGMTTKSPEERAEELSNTSVPTPFSVVWSAEVLDAAAAEKYLHGLLHHSRVNDSREFFWLDSNCVEKLNEYIEDYRSLYEQDFWQMGTERVRPTYYPHSINSYQQLWHVLNRINVTKESTK